MSGRHPRRKKNAGRFAMLPVTVLNTDAVITLSHAAHRVMVLLAAEYNGGNNGALGITANQAIARGIGSDHTLYRALRTLEKHGLIERTYPASRVPPRPTMYLLTWLSVDDTNYSRKTRIPTHIYRQWKPSNSTTKTTPKVRLHAVQ